LLEGNYLLAPSVPLKRVSSERHARARAAAAVLASFLALTSACQKFTANGAAGGSGDAGAAGEPQAGASGSADLVATSGSGGAPEQAGGDAGAAASGAPGIGGAGAGGGSNTAGGPSAGAGGGPVSQCPCAAPTPTCEAGRCVVRGPTMIKVNPFYIDSTEVTVAQYAVFAKLKPATPADQAPECSWNTSYDPVFVQDAPLALPNYPVTNVDFCDAAAFCAWADKRLCGNIDGGPIALTQLADPGASQWFASCTGPKSQQYPYGAAYESGACNDQNGAKKLLEVGTEPKCQGYCPGLFDMLGNAQEWVDACDAKAGPLDGCERIGGSYESGADTVCSTSGLAQRNAYAPQVGFRCCGK
jgi:sulfatase modifying factor 1